MNKTTQLFKIGYKNYIVCFLLTAVGISNASSAQSYEIPNNIQRIVFLGNSITYGGRYIEYIDAYLTVKYPEKNYEIINVGLPSETVSGLSEPNHANGRFPRPDLRDRLERLLTKLKPDLILACYGINDGIYMPFDDFRFNKFKLGINWLHDEIEKFGAEIIHITPSVFDERKGKPYDNVMDIYASWLISNRYTSNWEVIDTYWPMKKSLQMQRLVDPNFAFSKDGIHPNQQGHFIIAKHILLYLNANELDSSENFENFISSINNGEEIFRLIEKRQRIQKDSWLSHIGHERPGMQKGLPLKEAKEKINALNKQIQNLLD